MFTLKRHKKDDNGYSKLDLLSKRTIEKSLLKYYHDYNYHKALNIMPLVSI